MKRKIETLKVLKSEILDLLQQSKNLDTKLLKLNPEKINAVTPEDDLIVLAYYLSGIYSSFEEIFVKIAKEFENKIEDTTQWHLELLNRMALEIEDIRPAIISRKTQNILDELRRFRHMFRFSYAFRLDWERMRLAIKQWNKESRSIHQDIEDFLKYLDKLEN